MSETRVKVHTTFFVIIFTNFFAEHELKFFLQNSTNYRKGNDFLSDKLSVINLRRVYVWIDFRFKIINSIRFSIICWKVDTEQVYRISDPVRLSRAMAKRGWFPPSLTVEAKLRRPSTQAIFFRRRQTLREFLTLQKREDLMDRNCHDKLKIQCEYKLR